MFFITNLIYHLNYKGAVLSDLFLIHKKCLVFHCIDFGVTLQCNNPMTKEPKLQAAMRIVPEWQDYDQEIKQLHSRFQQEKGTETLTTTTNETKQQSREGSALFLSLDSSYTPDNVEWGQNC